MIHLEKTQMKDMMRKALGSFATGVAVVTGRHPEFGFVGLTISSFNSVSLDPPLILWSISSRSASRAAFQKDMPFVVNVLASHQRDICTRFATASHNKFDGLDLRAGQAGVPKLEGSAAYFECETDQVVAAGDHELYIGRVTSVEIGGEHRPLIFHRSRLSELPLMQD